VLDFNVNGDKNVTIFIGLPDYGGPTYEDGFPLVPKLQKRAEKQLDGSYKFLAKLVQANDSYCSKEWYVPKEVSDVQVGWMAAEEGVYNVSGSMFVIDSGLITRDNSVPVSEDTPVLYHHVVTFNYTSGCDEVDPDRPCEFPAKVDESSSKTWLHLGALQQIQTSINTIDDGNDLWMTIRSRNVFTDRVQFLLATHSVDLNLHPSYETITVPEVAGYFIFEKDRRIQCVEGLVFETQISFPVTSEAIDVDFFFTYDYPPGIFGMLGSLNSLGDSTALRAFERTTSHARYITQEDQCFDEETRHTTPERSFALIAGESSTLDIDRTRCFISYEYSSPTSAPSGQPTIGPTMLPTLLPTDSDDSLCGSCLADGEYIFRSTGVCDPFGESVSWDFCGVSGKTQTEFHFWMEDGVCYPGVLGGACDSLSSSPTSIPLEVHFSGTSDSPSLLSSASPTVGAKSVGVSSDESTTSEVIGDGNVLLFSVSILSLGLFMCALLVGCCYYCGAFGFRPREDALKIEELGEVTKDKLQARQASLSICLDIDDSDHDNEFNSSDKFADTPMTPAIAGTFLEEDVNMFHSDVFS
jgi:hypothetical protein